LSDVDRLALFAVLR